MFNRCILQKILALYFYYVRVKISGPSNPDFHIGIKYIFDLYEIIDFDLLLN